MSDRGTDQLVADGMLNAELAALVWLLAEGDVPLTVVSNDPTSARELRQAIAGLLPADRRAADVAIAGGTVIGSSLEDVLRLLGGADHQLSDEARDLGLVLVVADGRVTAAHYLRPVERDAAGHVQRRPPAVLAAWGDRAGSVDLFYWAITDELATRVGMTRGQFEDELAKRAKRLAAPQRVVGLD